MFYGIMYLVGTTCPAKRRGYCTHKCCIMFQSYDKATLKMVWKKMHLIF